MGLFKSKQDKALEKKMLMKKTINHMKRHIEKLEEQKKVYTEAAKRAMKQGLDAQVNLAVSGLKMTMAQQRKANEMLLNFEITSQMKDMSQMTSQFLGGMGTLSKEMVKLADNKEFAKVQQQFEKAMLMTEEQSERMELFLDDNKTNFASISVSGEGISDEEIEKLIMTQASLDDISQDDIDKELETIKTKLS